MSDSRSSLIENDCTATIIGGMRLLRGARLKVTEACIEDINYKAARGSTNSNRHSRPGEWLRRSQNLLITGATGFRQDVACCALAQQCCRQGASVQYWRLPR